MHNASSWKYFNFLILMALLRFSLFVSPMECWNGEMSVVRRIWIFRIFFNFFIKLDFVNNPLYHHYSIPIFQL